MKAALCDAKLGLILNLRCAPRRLKKRELNGIARYNHFPPSNCQVRAAYYDVQCVAVLTYMSEQQ